MIQIDGRSEREGNGYHVDRINESNSPPPCLFMGEGDPGGVEGEVAARGVANEQTNRMSSSTPGPAREVDDAPDLNT